MRRGISKIITLIFASMVLVCGIQSILYAHSGDGTVHFHDVAPLSVAENTASGTNISAPVTAHNFGGNQDEYRLSGTEAQSFRIDKNTGQLKTHAALDFETKNSYTVEVEAWRSRPQVPSDFMRVGSTIVTINVTNISPNVTITVPMDVQFGAFTATITFNESVSDFTAGDITLGGESATVTNVTGGDRTYTATITPDTTADGDVTIRVPAGVAQDAGGSGNTASDTHTVHVEPDETIWMPDANLRREVHKSPGPADHVRLTQTAMKDLLQLFAGDEGITDLTGLEYATEAVRLEIHGGSVRDLTPLAGLTELRVLVAHNNNIMDLTPLSGLSFFVLYLWGNPFLELPSAEITVPAGVQTGAFDVTIAFGQRVADFEQSDLSISGTANATITSWDANIEGDQYTATITPAADGDVMFNVAAGVANGVRRTVLRQLYNSFIKINIEPPVGDADPVDATLADLQEPNIAAEQQTVTVNMALPTARIDVPSGVQDERFEVTVVFSEAVTGFQQTELSVTGTAGATITDWQPQTGGTDYTATIASTGDGVVVLNVAVDVAQDAGGNKNTAAPEKRVQVEIPDETIWMPDANLRREVHKSPGPADHVRLTQTAMKDLLQLFAGDKGITDLTGLEYATEAVRLEIHGGSVRDLTPLAGLTELRVLVAHNNNIMDLTPLSGLSFFVLYLWGNPFLELPSAEITVPAGVQTGAFDVTIAFGQRVTGFEQSDLSISGTANATITSWDANIEGDQYIATIAPAADGDVVFNVAAGVANGVRRTVLRQLYNSFIKINIEPPVGDADPVDATLADLQEPNIAAEQQTVTVNMALPTARIDVPSGVQDERFEVTVVFSEAVTGFQQTELSVTGTAGATITDWQPQTGGTDYTATIASTGDGVVVLNVAVDVAQDAGGNKNTAAPEKRVQVEIPDETIWMPDANLRREVHKSPGPADHVRLTQTAMKDLLQLFAGDKGITDLTGLEYATEAVRLEIHGGSVRDLTPLAGLTELRVLVAHNNNIMDLTPLSGLSFFVLYLWGNPFLELPSAEITVPAGVQTGAFDVTIAFGQRVTGFEQSDLSISGTANATITSWDANIEGDQYIATIAPAADGDVVFNVAAGVANGVRRTVLRQLYNSFIKINIEPPVGDADPVDATLADLQEPNTAAEQQTVNVNLPDETGPSVEITGVPTTTQNGSFTVTITFSESVTGFAAEDITLSGTATTTATLTGSGTTYTATITPTTDGSVTISVAENVAQDAAGNQNEAATAKTVQVDITKPTVSINVPSGEQTGEFDVTITFGESVTGFVQSELTFTTTGTAGATITNWTGQDGDTTYTATVLPTGIGNLVFSVAADVAQDTAGNSNTAATQRTVAVNRPTDTTRPTVSVSVPSGMQNGAFDVTITFSESVTGFADTDITLSGTATTTATLMGSGTTYTATITPTTDGSVTISVAENVAQDAAGNQNEAATAKTVQVDITKPTVSINVPSGEQTGEFDVTITFGESVTGFVQSELTFTTTGTAGATITNWTGQDGDRIYTATVLPTGTGDLVFSVAANVAQDTAGNSNTAATQRTVAVNRPTDTTRPRVGINVPSGVQNKAFTVTITFSEAVTGFADTDIMLTGVTATATLTGSGTTYTATITPTSIGTLTIRVPANGAQDASGNRNIASETYTVLVNPTGPSDPITEQGPEPLIIVETEDGTKYATGTPPFAGTVTDPVIFYVIIKFDEPVTGFVLDDLTLGTFEDVEVPEANRRVSITEWSGQDDNLAYTAKVYTAKVRVTKNAFVSIWVPANVAQAADNGAWNIQSAKQSVAVWIDGAAKDEDIVRPGARIEVLPGPGVTIVMSPGRQTDIIEEIRITGIFKIAVVFREPVSGFEQTDLRVRGAGNTSAANITDWMVESEGVRYTATLEPTREGDLIIQVPDGVAQDAAGNENVPAVTFINVDFPDQADPTPPTVTLEAPDTAQGTFDVTITFSEAVIDFTQADLSLSGTARAAITGWTTTDNITYTATLTPNVEGEVVLNVPANVARDLANNANTAAEKKNCYHLKLQ